MSVAGLTYVRVAVLVSPDALVVSLSLAEAPPLACFSSNCLLRISLAAIEDKAIKRLHSLLSLMQEMNNPCHSYQTDSHSRCKGEALSVSRCFHRLPENQRRPDGRRLSYSVHNNQGKCSFIDVVFENVVCPTTVSQSVSRLLVALHGDDKRSRGNPTY